MRYTVAFLATSALLGYCALAHTERVVDAVEVKREAEPVTPPPLPQIYVITKVLGIQEAEADASTMEVSFAQQLDDGFSKLGQKDRVRRSLKKFNETEACKDKSCDIVAIEEQERNYQLRVICPSHPKTKTTTGALEEIPCAANVTRQICRKLVLISSVRAITAHDAAYHPQRRSQ